MKLLQGVQFIIFDVLFERTREAVRERKLMMTTRVMPLTLKTTQMMSFLLLSPQMRNTQTSGQLQHAQDEL